MDDDSNVPEPGRLDFQRLNLQQSKLTNNALYVGKLQMDFASTPDAEKYVSDNLCGITEDRGHQPPPSVLPPTISPSTTLTPATSPRASDTEEPQT